MHLLAELFVLKKKRCYFLFFKPHHFSFITVLAHDADASAEIRYSLEPAVDHKEYQASTSVFSIDPYSGVITTLVLLDRETVSEYRLNVVASDNGSPPLTATTQVYIDVMDYNDNPPIFAEDPYLASGQYSVVSQ